MPLDSDLIFLGRVLSFRSEGALHLAGLLAPTSWSHTGFWTYLETHLYPA